MNVIKRNGSVAEFNKSKIYDAVYKAFIQLKKTPEEANQVAEKISNEIESSYKDGSGVEDIQDIVEKKLMASSYKDVAKAYINYRYQKAQDRALRENLEDRYERLEKLITGRDEESNKENSNKDTRIIPTMRDYIAGYTCRELATKVVLPKDIAEAHEAGIIHYHDTDYSPIMPMTNCFSGNTVFVSNYGAKSFNSFYDGQSVEVKDKDGNWRVATVKKYGKQKMYDIVVKTQKMTKKITATANHRWILKDGTVTTNLKVGDVLYPLSDSTEFIPETFDDYKWFAYGFVIGDGCDRYGNNKDFYGVRCRLCGHKNEYLPYFIKAGYNYTISTNSTDYIVYNNNEFSKQEFLKHKCWKLLNRRQLQALFYGFYKADGAVDSNRLSTSNKNVEELIEDISCIAGYYISSKTTQIRDTEYKKGAALTTYHFVKKQSHNNLWRIESIRPHAGQDLDAWCVEEPITHTFTLDGGIVTGNCCLINLKDMLENGTVISHVKINKPHSFRTACTISTQIITQVASSQYGGNTITLAHLAPFIDVSRKQLRKKHPDFTDEQIESLVKDEIKDGVQTIQYQLITMSTTNGQAPFTSIFMWINEVEEGQERKDLAMLIEEVLRQRIEGVPNEQGAPITIAFPKLLYCLDENNIHEGDPYWYLTELAAECSAKRLVPDYISAKKMRELKGDVYPCMGCRSFLTPDPVNHKYYGRFNQGVVTLNLVDVALSSDKDMDKFWNILEERLNLCYRALMTRHDSLKGIKSDIAPILWQDGAYARLKPDETIDKLLYNNYSTISLGYAGLYECIHYMTGGSQLDEKGKEFGLSVMKKLNDTCTEWRNKTNISFSLYGSPIESTTYKFAKSLKKRFGVIEGITDKDYVTNSYHITPAQKIDAFNKLRIESEFQELSPRGAISYIETPNMAKNIPALIEVIKYIYEHIMYAEINTMTSYCHKCGCTDIYMGDDFEFHCPQCGNSDYNKMNVAVRICGYISTNPFNKGRANDIHDRVYHLGD